MPKGRFVLGVDIGTTHCKAVLFDEFGTIKSLVSVDTVTHHDASGNFYYLPDELWKITADMISRVVSAILPSELAGLSVASMAESGLPLDHENQPTYPIIPYFDENAASQAQEIGVILGKDEIFKLTGVHLSPIASLTKLRWLQKNQPEAFLRTRKWLCVSDYINFRLTGEMTTDYSIATRTMAFDIFKCQWSEQILQALGMDSALFPLAVPSGSLIGRVTREAARQTGLLEGLPVIAGGHDHLCGSLGAGLLLGNRLIDSSGTAESLLGLLGGRVNRVTTDLYGAALGRYVDGKSFYVSGGFSSSGNSVDWIIARCASHIDWAGDAHNGPLDYETIMRQAYQRSPGADQLLYLPHLRGCGCPEWDGDSRGCFVGLRPSHRSPDLVRAVLEGVCFELRFIYEHLHHVIPYDIRKITTIGGGARNKYWLQIKADIIGVPVEVPVVKEATALGAALLAGVGSGVYTDLDEATRRTYQVDQLLLPNQELRLTYDQLYRIYRQLYPALKEINGELTRLDRAND